MILLYTWGGNFTTTKQLHIKTKVLQRNKVCNAFVTNELSAVALNRQNGKGYIKKQKLQFES